MSTEDRLNYLLSLWQEQQAQGRDLSSAELCRDCPDLEPQLSEKIRLLRHRDALHGTPETVPILTVVQTQPQEQQPADRGQTPAGKDMATAEPAPPAAQVPDHEIVKELGRGGMGVVYLARQLRLGRLVALKMVLAGSHAGKAEMQRFRTEAEAVARLQHPNIVQVFAVGEHEGRPFLSLEFCPGGSLDRKLAGAPLPPDEAAQLVETLARAMQAAHQAQVIHRDLKPANVLLAADGTAKITDFGLAKMLDEVGQTQTGAVMGTPSYMAPEQAEGKKTVGPAADVYALGAILYECLTGRPPFKAATLYDTMMQVIAQEPVSPRQLNVKVPVDLETICLKCLEKEPAKRYAAAEALADDLARFRAGQPVAARPVGTVERGWRWCRRNPAVAGLLLAVFLTLALGASAATFFAVQESKRAGEAEQARQAAAQRADAERKAKEETGEALALVETQKKQTEQALRDLAAQKQETDRALQQAQFEQARAEFVAYAVRLNAARQMVGRGELAEATDQLRLCDPKLYGWEHAYLLRQCQRELWSGKHGNDVRSVAISADGKWIVSGSVDRLVKVWDAVTGREVCTLKGHKDAVWSVAVSADGKRIVSGSWDRTVKVWDALMGQEVLTLRGHTGIVLSVALSADGQRIVSGSDDKTVKVWDALSGQEVLTLKGHKREVTSVALSVDGKRIAAGCWDESVKVWDAATGQETLSLPGHTGPVMSVAFSSDGKRLVSGSSARLAGQPGTVKVWDTATGREVFTLNGHKDAVQSVAFAPDGKRLVSGSRDGTVKVWDAATGQEAFTLNAHISVFSVAFAPDGKRLVSGGGKAVTVWDAATDREFLSLTGHTRGVRSVAFSGDGKHIVSGSSGAFTSQPSEVKVWDAQTGQEGLTIKHPDGILSVALSPDGKRLGAGSWDRTVKVWDATTGQEAFTLRGHTDRVMSVAFSPDGKRIVSGSLDRSAKVWDAATGQEVLSLKGHTDRVLSVAFAADGTRIVSGSVDKTVKVWDARTGLETRTLKGHTAAVASVAFSPDGRRIVSGSADKTVKVWDAATGQAAFTLRGHTDKVTSVAFAAGGKRLVSGSADKTVRLWDAATGQEAFTLRGPLGVNSVAFAVDGKRIVSDSGQVVRVWDASPVAGQFPSR